MAIAQGVCPFGDHPFEYETGRQGPKPTYCTPQHAWKAAAQRAKLRVQQQERRTCSRCKTEKSREDFGSLTAPHCRPCHTEYERERRIKRGKQDPAYTRTLNLRRYGLTPDSFAALLAEQGGRCKICRTATPDGYGWVVDHDHSCCGARKASCGRCNRGILCSRCNIAIGNFRDDPAIIHAALRYVLDYRKQRADSQPATPEFFGMRDNRKERSATAKLTEKVVAECRLRYTAGEKQETLAAEFGVTSGAMCNAIRGKTWAGPVLGVEPVPRNLKPSQRTESFQEAMAASGRKGAEARWHPDSLKAE